MKLKTDNLLALLERNPESRRKFAKRAGVSVQALDFWIKGERNPKLASVKLMADALNCDVEDIAEFELAIEKSGNKKMRPYTILIGDEMLKSLENWCDRNEMMVSQAIRLAVKRMINNKDFTVE